MERLFGIKVSGKARSNNFETKLRLQHRRTARAMSISKTLNSTFELTDKRSQNFQHSLKISKLGKTGQPEGGKEIFNCHGRCKKSSRDGRLKEICFLISGDNHSKTKGMQAENEQGNERFLFGSIRRKSIGNAQQLEIDERFPYKVTIPVVKPKIFNELMLFGVLSLLMGHGIIIFAKICVKSSAFSSRFYPCSADSSSKGHPLKNLSTISNAYFSNSSTSGKLMNSEQDHGCPEGHEPFASYESLHQLHRFLFVLGVTHVFYSFVAIALAMIKIYSWRAFEDHAKSVVLQQGLDELPMNISKLRRLPTFISHRTSHPWSQHRVLVWLLCFSRQFWCSINQADYNALRLGFISTHQLPLTYDFHKYMLRSMEEEFRDIVGISIPLWIFGILCILLNYHGTNIYFWISFIPAILNLLIGTKLHRIVVKLAVEVMQANLQTGFSQFNLRDELFWFRKPRLLLLIIQFISFQNAFEMATYIWLQWENKKTMCLTQNLLLIVIRLTFGVVSQFWCSFITFPLYVIVTQMGSKFKKSIISENVRKSLHGWRKKVKTRRVDASHSTLPNSISTMSLDSMVDDIEDVSNSASERRETSPEATTEITQANQSSMTEINCQSNKITAFDESSIESQCCTYHDEHYVKDTSGLL